jgi:hypothetical protein
LVPIYVAAPKSTFGAVSWSVGPVIPEKPVAPVDPVRPVIP